MLHVTLLFTVCELLNKSLNGVALNRVVQELDGQSEAHLGEQGRHEFAHGVDGVNSLRSDDVGGI